MSPLGRQSLPRPKTQPFKTASIGIQNRATKSYANFAAVYTIASTEESPASLERSDHAQLPTNESLNSNGKLKRIAPPANSTIPV
jgi:hypothetical protein